MLTRCWWKIIWWPFFSLHDEISNNPAGLALDAFFPAPSVHMTSKIVAVSIELKKRDSAVTTTLSSQSVSSAVEPDNQQPVSVVGVQASTRSQPAPTCWLGMADNRQERSLYYYCVTYRGSILRGGVTKFIVHREYDEYTINTTILIVVYDCSGQAWCHTRRKETALLCSDCAVCLHHSMIVREIRMTSFSVPAVVFVMDWWLIHNIYI